MVYPTGFELVSGESMDFLDTPCISHGFESFGGPFGDHFGGLYAPAAFEAVECEHRAVRAPFRHWASRACMPLYLNSRIPGD